MLEFNEVKIAFDPPDDNDYTYLEVCRDETIIIIKMTREELLSLIALLGEKEMEMR